MATPIAANFVGPLTFRVVATDGQLSSVPEVFTLAVNSPPFNVLLSGPHTYLPSSPAGTIIGTLSARDIEGEAILVYTVTVGTSEFEVANGNELRVKTGVTLSVAATKSVTVSVTDGVFTVTQTFLLTEGFL